MSDQEQQDEATTLAILSQLIVLRIAVGLQIKAAKALEKTAKEMARLVNGYPSELIASKRLDTNKVIAAVQKAALTGYESAMEGLDLEVVAAAVAAKTVADLEKVTEETAAPLSSEALKTLALAAAFNGTAIKRWMHEQARQAAFRAANNIRAGVSAGSTNAEIAAIVKDTALGVGARHLAAVAKTSALSVANEVREAVYSANSGLVVGKMQVSVLDSRTSAVCITYSGATWDLNGKPIGKNKLAFRGGTPRHWGCRSVIVPLIKGAAIGKVTGPLSFASWLSSQPDEVVNASFGVGRAELWRSGDITLSQLLDMNGRPISLKQMAD